MSQHDHNPDLIMALAEGSADITDAERAAVAACVECAADLSAQETALTALRSAPAVELTELEAARVLRRLDVELGHERTPAAARHAPTRRRFSWAPAFSIAAVVLALVLVAPAMNLLGGGDDEASGDFDAALSATTTTVVGDGGAAELAPTRESLEAAAEPGAPDATVPQTTVAPASEDGVTLSDAGGDGDSPLTLAEVQAIIEGAGRDPELSREGVAAVTQLEPPAIVDVCVSEGVDVLVGTVSSFTLGDLLVTPTAGDVVLYGVAEFVTVTVHELADGSLALVSHEPLSCEVLATVP